jgi:hypothetical protein
MADPGPVVGQPDLLGFQIALHPARARRIEHGGVHQARARILGRGLENPERLGDLLVPAGDQAKIGFGDVEIDQAHG